MEGNISDNIGSESNSDSNEIQIFSRQRQHGRILIAEDDRSDMEIIKDGLT